MKIVVIGIGQLGTDMVEVLKGIGLAHSKIDVTNYEKSYEALKELKPDVIINTAAFHNVDKCEEEPDKAFLVNSVGAYNIARVSSELSAINVYISTDYVFDGNKREGYTEEDIPEPLNIYGFSKKVGEEITARYSKKYYICLLYTSPSPRD